MQSIKFRCGSEIRRDTLPISQLTFTSLLDDFHELFGCPVTHHRVRYRDDQGELVDLSSDRELKEALRLTSNKLLELNFGTHYDHPKSNMNPKRRHSAILPGTTADGQDDTAHQFVRPPQYSHASSERRPHPKPPQRQRTEQRERQPLTSATSHDRGADHNNTCSQCHLETAGPRQRCIPSGIDLCNTCHSLPLRDHYSQVHQFERPPRRWHHGPHPPRRDVSMMEEAPCRPAVRLVLPIGQDGIIPVRDDDSLKDGVAVKNCLPTIPYGLSREELVGLLKGNDRREKIEIVRSLLESRA